MEQNLKRFLKIKAQLLKPEIFDEEYPDNTDYCEHINADAINDEAWLASGTSYIWKIGVFAAWDSNKCDWVNVFIGHQRSPDHKPEFIGHLTWADGENDDIGRCLRRYLHVLDCIHPVFGDN